MHTHIDNAVSAVPAGRTDTNSQISDRNSAYLKICNRPIPATTKQLRQRQLGNIWGRSLGTGKLSITYLIHNQLYLLLGLQDLSK